MTAIYKYIINPDNQSTLMPEGAKILSVGFQREDFCIWAEVEPGKPVEPRNFSVFRTGWVIPQGIGEHKYIGTAHMDNGLVFHAYETYT